MNIDNGLFDRAYRTQGMYYGWHTHELFNYALEICGFDFGRALDIGSGEGRYAIALANHGFSVLAVDKSEVGISKLRKIVKTRDLDIQCVLADLMHFKFPSNEYHFIVASTVLDHLPTNTMEHVVCGIKESLKPNGVLYASVFTVQDPGYTNRKGRDALNDVSECASGIRHYFELGELRKIFQAFEVVRYTETFEFDSSHGSPHHHGIARLVARKPGR